MKEFIPIIKLHAFAGDALIKTHNPIFDEPKAVKICLDLLSERGYHANYDLKIDHLPESIDRETFTIKCKTERLHVFRVKFNKPLLRK